MSDQLPRQYTALQLLLRRYYGGVDLTEQDASAELQRRGWIWPYRFLLLLLIVPLIWPERLIVAMDMGDPYETADLDTILFSASFSALIMAALVFTLALLTGTWIAVGISAATFFLILAWLRFRGRRN